MQELSKFFFSANYHLLLFFVLLLNVFPKVDDFSTHFLLNIVRNVKVSNVLFNFVVQIIAVLSVDHQIPHQRHENHCPDQMSPNIHNLIMLLEHRNDSIFERGQIDSIATFEVIVVD